MPAYQRPFLATRRSRAGEMRCCVVLSRWYSLDCSRCSGPRCGLDARTCRNYWVPLSDVSGSNSLWSETAPFAGDFAPFEAGPGQAVRFYGNRCRHYTTANDPDGAARQSARCT